MPKSDGFEVTKGVCYALTPKAKLEQLVRQANKDRLGRKIKADDLIKFSLGLLTDAHLEQISAKVMTNEDRMELLYLKLSKEKRGMSREEFLGMLLDGQLNGEHSGAIG